MMKYRAIRKPGEQWWRIEEFDTEHQISSVDPTRSFESKFLVENYIKTKLLNPPDHGEVGEWFNGSF